jgi:hypothetical protein
MLITAFTTGIRNFSLITFLFVLFSCGSDTHKDLVLIDVKSDYRFINTLPDTVYMIGYKNETGKDAALSFKKLVLPNDSFVISTEWNTLRIVDVFSSKSGYKADSIVLDFNNGKCTNYSGPLRFTEDTAGTHGFWNYTNYRNYKPGLFSGEFSYFYLSYDIGARDSVLAVPCP